MDLVELSESDANNFLSLYYDSELDSIFERDPNLGLNYQQDLNFLKQLKFTARQWASIHYYIKNHYRYSEPQKTSTGEIIQIRVPNSIKFYDQFIKYSSPGFPQDDSLDPDLNLLHRWLSDLFSPATTEQNFNQIKIYLLDLLSSMESKPLYQLCLNCSKIHSLRG